MRFFENISFTIIINRKVLQGGVLFVLLCTKVDLNSFEEGSVCMCVYIQVRREKKIRLSKFQDEANWDGKRNGKLLQQK